MRAVWRMMATEGGMGRAMVLAVIVLLAGAGLLALSGWFITAAAAAGLAGAGVMFDVFRPAASVRGLAILRTASRYGERWLGHDATLRAVVRLRTHVLTGLSRGSWAQLQTLRRGPALAQVLADTQVLDAMPLRLILPSLAAAMTLLLGFALLWALIGWQMALWICGAHLMGALLAGVFGMRRAGRLAPQLARQHQAFRSHALDLVAARDDLVLYGHDGRVMARALAHENAARELAFGVDAIGRDVGLALDLSRLAAMIGALALGALGVRAGQFGPEMVGLGFFAAVALGEAAAPLRRAITDFGAVRDAADRVAVHLPQAQPKTNVAAEAASISPAAPQQALPLQLDDLRVNAGQMLAISGASGAGKSTCLARIAGLIPPGAHDILLGPCPISDWPEAALREVLTLVPQRPALIMGSLRDNLRLAAPKASDAELLDALRCVCLDHLRGGLDLTLGEGGRGLSGGEARRLAMARGLLRQPRILLLDEPTEGLDAPTAARMMQNLRARLGGCALVVASHRRLDLQGADFTLNL